MAGETTTETLVRLSGRLGLQWAEVADFRDPAYVGPGRYRAAHRRGYRAVVLLHALLRRGLLPGPDGRADGWHIWASRAGLLADRIPGDPAGGPAA